MYTPIKISLQVATELDNASLLVLEMRPPTSDDVIHAQKMGRAFINGNIVADEGEQEAHLFAALTNTTREFIGQLAFYDYVQLQKAYDCFLLPVPQFAARSVLLFPSSAAGSPSENSAD
ncbi:phage tail assembly protein [Vibrio sp. PP-XX7]